MEAGHKKNGNRKNRTSDFLIKVTSTDQASYQGTVEHVQTGQIQYFRSFLEMFFLINRKLDENGFPQATTETRSWQD